MLSMDLFCKVSLILKGVTSVSGDSIVRPTTVWQVFLGLLPLTGAVFANPFGGSHVRAALFTLAAVGHFKGAAGRYSLGV